MPTGVYARPGPLDKIDAIDNDGCWPWLGKLSHGYGRYRGRPADRVVYELLVGPIPDGLQLDHTCHNDDVECPAGDACTHRRCCNPDHLEPVTSDENTRRALVTHARRAARYALLTQCCNGHPRSEANTRCCPDGRRQCRVCARERMRRARAATKKEAG